MKNEKPPFSYGRIPILGPLYRKLRGLMYGRQEIPFTYTQDYWETRYAGGGNSGSGSFNRLAHFKADVINQFVGENNIQRVIEFGCGDGNQLKLYRFNTYIGFDVSPSAIKRCITAFQQDNNKSFFLYDPHCFQDHAGVFKSDLSMSIDVIYHLVESELFEKYLHDLFSASTKHVVIYSTNEESAQINHVRNRKITDFIDANFKQWTLARHVPNPYPYDAKDEANTSDADFFIYSKNDG